LSLRFGLTVGLIARREAGARGTRPGGIHALPPPYAGDIVLGRDLTKTAL